MRISIFVFLLIFTQLLTAQSSKDVSTLIAALLADTPIDDDLRELCDDIGGRVTGSEANEKAVESCGDFA